MKKLCVIGSINTDLVANVKRFPLPGETISGTQFNTFFGGKGANQAVAAGKLGATVTMLGKVGDDMYGTQYCENFVSNNVDISAIDQTKGISTGTAVIFVEGSGENSIVIIPGANGEVSAQFIKSKSAVLKSADIFLLQLEIPMASVLFAAQSLKTLKKTIIP